MKKNKLVILITGASSGIGRSTADLLLKQGHQVIGLSRSEPHKPYDFQHVKCDVSSELSVKAAIESIVKEHSKIDVLINCAGIGISGPLENMTLEQAKKTLDVNVLGAFLMSKYALPYLRDTKGIIFNIGSVAGPITIPFQTFYSMSKAALQSFTEGLRLELKPLGVRAVSILPGDTKTSFTTRREKMAEDAIYGKRLDRSIKVMEHDEQNGKDPISVARVINKLLFRKHPPVAVTIGFSYKLLVFLNKFLPKKLVQVIVYSIYGK
jgi:NAD(P)-dependent dehydrogenase (short-subunit alcohol dehydrogenase family)